MPSALDLAASDLRAAPWIPPFRLVLRDLAAEVALETCIKGPGARRFTLTIHAGLASTYPAAAVPLLVHGAAHMVAWSARGQSDHGPAFGRAYASIWRLLHPPE